MVRKKVTYEQNKMSLMCTGLGIGRGCNDMVANQKARNTKPLNLGLTTEKQRANKMHIMCAGLGLSHGCNHMVLSQKDRDGRGRGHGALTLDQAYELTAELLIRQSGRCWVTGTELVINGCADNVRSYSIDRLDDSKGYSVENCRAVCVWVNLATAQYPRPYQKITLWRHLSRLPPLPTEVAENGYPDFCQYFTDPVCLESALNLKGIKRTKDRIPTWLPYFDLPPIVPFSDLTDEEVLELLG
jgi:hypothetical protein